MGDLARDRPPTTTRRADHAPHDRAGNLRKQRRRAHSTHRRPPRAVRHPDPHDPARRVIAARARVLPAPLPLVTLDPKLAIGNGNPLPDRTERLAGAVTLGLGVLFPRGGGLLAGAALIRKRDNPRIIECVIAADIWCVAVCAGHTHGVPHHVVRPTIVLRNLAAEVSSAMSTSRLNRRVLGPIPSPNRVFTPRRAKNARSISGTGVQTQSCIIQQISRRPRPAPAPRPWPAQEP